MCIARECIEGLGRVDEMKDKKYIGRAVHVSVEQAAGVAFANQKSHCCLPLRPWRWLLGIFIDPPSKF